MLQINSISKKFDEKVLFTDLSYAFEKGIYIIKGESGKGKTTLLRMIAGLDNDFDGEIVGGGAANVSFSFQEYRLFEHLNALENITVIFNEQTEKNRDIAKNTLDALGIFGKDQLLYPDEMSGGMKLRVSIARALCKPAPVLLLDEPTRELNTECIEKIATVLNARQHLQTIIIVTHDNSIEQMLDSPKILKI